MRKKITIVHGVGTNDADYVVQKWSIFVDESGKKKQKLLWICPFYCKWRSMLSRCYSTKFQEKYPTYRGCYVCEEWLIFSNFKSWMEKQDWQGKSLDKDILFPENKLYSPSTCIFLDKKVNTFLIERNASRGEYMIGVYWHKQLGKFVARCNDSNSLKHLGVFSTEIEAHKAWLSFKLEQAKLLAAEQTDPRVAKALIDRYENYVIRGDKDDFK